MKLFLQPCPFNGRNLHLRHWHYHIWFAVLVSITFLISCGSRESDRRPESAPADTPLTVNEVDTSKDISPAEERPAGTSKPERTKKGSGGGLVSAAKKKKSDPNNSGVSASGEKPAAQNSAYGKNTIGSVAYYCPDRMVRRSQYFVTVSVSKEKMGEIVKDVTQSVMAQVPDKAPQVKGDSLFISDTMKTELVYSPEYFKTVSGPQNSEQYFTSAGTLEWDWIIEPVQVSQGAPVQIKISYLKNGIWYDAKLPYKIFNVVVRIDARNFWDKITAFLLDDPKFFLTFILIPAISFIAGFFTHKIKNK